MFRLDKRKIFLLYHYYLLGDIQKIEEGKNEKEKERIIWFDKCLEKEKLLVEKINKKLKEGWNFSSLPPLEKSILVYATHELLLEKNANLGKMIIDQVINFSKAYLEEGKYKYINKVLDLIIKEEKVIFPDNFRG